MAETVVNFVLGRLADAAVKEVLLLRGVDKQVEKVKRELIRIQALLKDADSKSIKDERQRNWVKEIRDVAYWIEDVVDSAFLLEDSPETKTPQEKMSCFPCKTNTVKRMFRKPRKLPALHKLGEEMDQILTTIKEINESRITYGISNLGEGSGGPLRLPIRPPVLPDIDDPDVVGLDEDANNIVQQLLDENTKRRSVVSIVGIGGLGKTTLARKVYNRIDIKRCFDTCIWVTVSQGFKLIELLKKIVEQFQPINPSEHGKDEEYFINKLHESCKGKKYLVVLDDVWSSDDLWNQMGRGRAFPDENNGSRLLITTRFLDVAIAADLTSEPYQLKFLSEESSLQLLLKKALPNYQYTSKEYPNYLVDLAKQFVKKCGGLPLALMVLGGLLSKKPDYHAWSKMMQTMKWGVNGKVCIEVLDSSYEDLPLALKPCFMYFALFPEDRNIYAERLIRMWVAEGLIPEVENRTLEDTAESFLEELVQRCMIQVSSRRIYDSSIEYCRIHDLLRDLAIQKAKEDNFLAVYSNEDDLTSCSGARRVAIHNSGRDELMNNLRSNLRSLVCFGPTPDCRKKRLLKVLRTEKIEKWLEDLSQLRYFEYYFDFRSRNICVERCNMKFLQTLDLRELLHDLPDSIWLVKTLRHVMLHTSIINGTTRCRCGPPSWTDLRNLQTLSAVRTRKWWAGTAGIPNLPNLRTLELQILEGLSWEVVATFLGTLKHLKSLTLINKDATLKVPDMSGFHFYPHLQYLYLASKGSSEKEEIPLDTSTKHFSNNEVPLVTNPFPIHLTVLTLDGLEFDRDPMPILEKLKNLKELNICFAECMKKMRFPAKSFVQLEHLELMSIKNLEELVIEEGAMPMLRKLDIYYCTQLRVPLGLRHLNSLEILYWRFREDDLASTKANELRNICKHVPKIEIYEF